MKLSPFNPIYFSDGADCSSMLGYVHTYSTDDRILIEIFHGNDEELPMLELFDCPTGEKLAELTWVTCAINGEENVSLYELRGLGRGDYMLRIGCLISNPIRITDDIDLLKDTILIQYSMRDNVSRRDVYPVLFGLQKYFEIRLRGGFKDEGWSFSVDNEQFVTGREDVVELYSYECTDKELTIGDSVGEPLWIGERFGLILACDLIFIDGCRYAKADDSDVIVSDGNLAGTKFVYSATMRQARYINATLERIIRATLRKVPSHIRKTNRHFRRI